MIRVEFYPERSWDAPRLNEFKVQECPNLESVEGLKYSELTTYNQ